MNGKHGTLFVFVDPETGDANNSGNVTLRRELEQMYPTTNVIFVSGVRTMVYEPHLHVETEMEK